MEEGGREASRGNRFTLATGSTSTRRRLQRIVRVCEQKNGPGSLCLPGPFLRVGNRKGVSAQFSSMTYRVISAATGSVGICDRAFETDRCPEDLSRRRGSPRYFGIRDRASVPKRNFNVGSPAAESNTTRCELSRGTVPFALPPQGTPARRAKRTNRKLQTADFKLQTANSNPLASGLR